MEIVIIRHGDPDYYVDSLTEKGWREAELLSQRLANDNIDDFYSNNRHLKINIGINEFSFNKIYIKKQGGNHSFVRTSVCAFL